MLVNVSSGAATLGSPGEYVQYAAAKAGVDALTLGLAQEVAGDGIRVVGVAPGIVETPIHADAGQPGRVERVGPLVPLGRAGHVEEVAAAVAWLMSEEASYITGTTLRVRRRPVARPLSYLAKGRPVRWPILPVGSVPHLTTVAA